MRPEHVLARITNRYAGRKVVLDELAGRIGKQDLARAGFLVDECAPVDVGADVAASGERRFACVDSDRRAQLDVAGPRVRVKSTLSRDGPRERVLRTPEDEQKGIVRELDLVPTGSLECFADEPLVLLGEPHELVAQLLHQSRRPRHVRVEERDGPGRELGHRAGSGGAHSPVSPSQQPSFR
jgi:hypothetical protein